MPAKQRIVGIDVCRSMAIIAATSSHAFVASGAFGFDPSVAMMWFQIATHLATPVFIGLFGSMLYIAYRPKFTSGRDLEGIQQLLSRSAQCYFLYLICILTWVVNGTFSAVYGLRCALLIGVTPFVDILKFYTVMLFAAPIIISVSTRFRCGLAILLALAMAPQLAYPLWPPLKPLPLIFGHDYLSLPASFLYGGNPGAGGPSLLHGLILVVYGMWLGKIADGLINGDKHGRRLARQTLLGATILSGLVSAALWDWSDAFGTLNALADMSLRNINHPLYYALGVFGLTIACWAALEFYDLRKQKIGRQLNFIGTTSLFTFSFGNIVLIVAPEIKTGLFGSIVYGIVLLFIVIALSWAFRFMLDDGLAQNIAKQRTFSAIFQSVQSNIISRIKVATRHPSIIYDRFLRFVF